MVEKALRSSRDEYDYGAAHSVTCRRRAHSNVVAFFMILSALLKCVDSDPTIAAVQFITGADETMSSTAVAASLYSN